MYDGVTEIRDDLIDNAKRPKKKRRVWIAATAAALAAALIGGGIAALIAGENGKNDAETIGGDTNAVALAEAVYPDRPRYPDMNRYDEREYDAWREDAMSRVLTPEERSALDGWKRTLVPALLSGAGERNAVCSPVSVYLALGMLAETTEGASREQILSALDADSVETLRAQADRVWNALYNEDGSYTLDLASSVWLRSDTRYDPSPLRILAENYHASSYSGQMGSGKYNALLREWLNDHTGGLLKDAVDGIELDGRTALALVTTTLFKDKWSAEFDPDKTETGVFHAPEGDMERDFMRKTASAEYVRGDNFSAITLAFVSGGEMNFLLPDEGVDAEEILADPAAVDWLTGSGDGDGVESKYLEVDLSLPKFDVTQDGEIGEKIKSLGVTDVFSAERADFSPIMGDGAAPGDVFLSQALHGARVAIDEEGCVGAAYTVLDVDACEPPPSDIVTLVFDRPFFFTVTNGSVPVFAGIVSEP